MNDALRLALKRRVARIYGAVPRTGPRRLIISYHAVGSGPWSTAEDGFGEQMAWLASHTRVRPLTGLLNGPENAQEVEVAVTFDDGYQSVLTNAAPVLARAGVSATLFVSTTRIADARRLASDESAGYYPGEQFLLWDELRQLHDLGWEIGSHTLDHPDLTAEPIARVRDQLTRSKQAIEARLGARCPLVAYPFGRHNRRVRESAAAAGYEWAMGATHGTLGPGIDRYAVPRIDIRRNYTLQDFIGVVRGDWDFLQFMQAARHTWRFQS